MTLGQTGVVITYFIKKIIKMHNKIKLTIRLPSGHNFQHLT